MNINLFYRHLDTFLLGLLSWVILHVLSVVAFPTLFPGQFPLLSARTQAKFHPKLVSLLFSLIIVCYAWPIVFSPSFQEMREKDWLLGYNAYASGVYSLALSYFVYDVVVTLYNGDGKEFLAHALLCMLVYAQTFKPFMTFHGAGLLMFEASTPFLHFRWFLLQLGFSKSRLYLWSSLAFAATFFVSRIIWGFFISIQGLIFLQDFKDQVGMPVFYFTHLAGLTLNLLNLYWFTIIIRKKRRGN